ncbi:transcription regulator [Zea mays]|uniref:Transcription regulator n=1 Tax=Zea mays TaxID=4577 RepID=A0A1D6I482_MAIZE|nr:transcription regulator [Zea mays]
MLIIVLLLGVNFGQNYLVSLRLDVKNFIGKEAAQDIIQEYLRRRGHIGSSNGTESFQSSNLQPYVKPSADAATTQTKKQTRTQKDSASSSSQSSKSQSEIAESQVPSKRGSKKKGAKVISLAEAAKGSIVFKQGKPCSCQARQHDLVSNCLSCGKIVCEQEGEGPCSFCGALVLKEGSTYAGLSDVGLPLSEAETAAEAYAKRLVDYDRNAAARTKVYDDQSDYYEMEGNSWLSSKERSVLKQQQEEAEEAAKIQKGKVIVTFDLVGRKVIPAGHQCFCNLTLKYLRLVELLSRRSGRVFGCRRKFASVLFR